jgi:dienelactone hydrolase
VSGNAVLITILLLGNNSPTSIVPTYFARPASPNGKAIILFSDIFGYSYPNTQLTADAFAARGYLTVIPDFFDGDSLSPEPFFAGKIDLPEWLTRHGVETVDPIAETVIDHLRNDLKVRKISGVGYCFGGKVRVRTIASPRFVR